MSPLAKTLTLVALLCPLTSGADCDSSDETSLVQLKSVVKHGKERDEDNKGENWPGLGDGLGVLDDQYEGEGAHSWVGGDAASEAVGQEFGASSELDNNLADDSVEAASRDSWAADQTGIAEDYNGAFENTAANVEAVRGTDAAAAAKAFVAATANEARAATISADAVENAATAEMVSDVKTLAANNAHNWAVATKEANEVHTAENQQVQDAVKVHNAIAHAGAAWTAGAEKTAYANTLRNAQAENVAAHVDYKNFLTDSARANHAIDVATAADEAKVHSLESAYNREVADEVKAIDTAVMADAVKAAKTEKAANSAAVAEALKQAHAATVANTVSAVNAAKARDARDKDVATAAHAAATEEVSNDWKVARSVDLADAKEVANVESVAAAATKASARQIAADNKATAAYAHGVAKSVAADEKARHAAIVNAAKETHEADAADVAQVKKFAQEAAAEVKADWQSAAAAKKATAKEAAADAKEVHSARVQSWKNAAAAEQQTVKDAYADAKDIVHYGAEEVKSGNEYAAADAKTTAHDVDDVESDYKATLPEIADALKADESESVSDRKDYAGWKSAEWKENADDEIAFDKAHWSSGVNTVDDVAAGEKADADEWSGDIDAAASGLPKAGAWGAYTGAAVGDAGYWGAAGYGGYEGVGSADALSGTADAAAAGASGMIGAER